MIKRKDIKQYAFSLSLTEYSSFPFRCIHTDCVCESLVKFVTKLRLQNSISKSLFCLVVAENSQLVLVSRIKHNVIKHKLLLVVFEGE